MVKGFGYCLFRTLVQALTGGEQNHSTIRLLLQRLENLNKYVFKELLTELNKPNIDEHMLHMGLHGTWGTPVEIFAITSYLRIATSFYLYSQQNNSP